MIENNKSVRLRTVDEIYKEIVKMDPDTQITKYFIKTLVKSNKIPSIKVGNRKRLINLDLLIQYLNNLSSQEKRGDSVEW